MTATAHALVAAGIASRFPDPGTAATLSFISHYILDSIPHWDWGTNWRARPKTTTGILAIAETLFGVGLALTIFWQSVHLPTLLLAIFAGLLPDWLETPWYIFFAHAKKYEPHHTATFPEKVAFRIYKLQNLFHTKTQLPVGILTQVAAVAFFLFLLK